MTFAPTSGMYPWKKKSSQPNRRCITWTPWVLVDRATHSVNPHHNRFLQASTFLEITQAKVETYRHLVQRLTPALDWQFKQVRSTFSWLRYFWNIAKSRFKGRATWYADIPSLSLRWGFALYRIRMSIVSSFCAITAATSAYLRIIWVWTIGNKGIYGLRHFGDTRSAMGRFGDQFPIVYLFMFLWSTIFKWYENHHYQVGQGFKRIK